MLLSLLKQSFSKQKKAAALMIISVAMGTAISASLITVSLEIRGKVSRELRSFGANITVVPRVEGMADLAGQKRYLREQDIIKVKTIFWRHNIIGVVPFLEEPAGITYAGSRVDVTAVGTWFEKKLPLPGEDAGFKAGVDSVLPWWDIQGERPGAGEVILGVSLAEELGAARGERVVIDGSPFKVSGTVATGGAEDRRAFMDLDALQSLKDRPDGVSRVLVSALTTPMDEFAYKDPETMSKAEYEKWYCTGYVTSIAKQVEEVFEGSRAKPIWRVAETEGRVLGRLTVLVYLLTCAAFLAAALGMSTTMAASVLRRLDEIGLMKALGADNLRVSLIFLSEALIVGSTGGLIGYALSVAAARYIGFQVFSTALTQRGMLFPIALASALLIAVLGSFLPIRRALRVKPVVVLKEAR